MNFFRGKDDSGGHESNVETEFYTVLQRAVYSKLIPPFHTRQQIVLLWTEPDFTWDQEDAVLYWDGPVHDKDHQGEKDDLQNAYLTKMGKKVIRIHYDGKPVSGYKKSRALQWVIDVLNDPRRGHLWEYDLEEGLE